MSINIQFTSYARDGTLVASLNGKRYKYYNVPPFQRRKMVYLLSEHNVGEVMKLLKRYSRPDLFMKHGFRDHEVLEEEVSHGR